jgi:hypothetical protein
MRDKRRKPAPGAPLVAAKRGPKTPAIDAEIVEAIHALRGHAIPTARTTARCGHSSLSMALSSAASASYG